MKTLPQMELPEMIVHRPVRPPRDWPIAEMVFSEAWENLMAQPLAEDEDAEFDAPEEVARLTNILNAMPGLIGQREASVAASFMKLPPNIPMSLAAGCALGYLCSLIR